MASALAAAETPADPAVAAAVPDPAAANAAPAATPPAATCPPLSEAVIGTWEPNPNGKGRKQIIEEYRPGNVWAMNGIVGAVTWQPDGTGLFTVGGQSIGTYPIALTDVNELITVDAAGGGTVYRRTSAPPSIPSSCFDLNDEILGTWTGPGYTETYEADGTYRVNGTAGKWRFEGHGHLVVELGGYSSTYWLGLVGTDKAIAIAPSRAGVVSQRQ